MVPQASLVNDLRAISGAPHAREPRPDDHVSVDGLSPRAVVSPGTYEEVAAVLRYANDNGLAVVPRGAGQQMETGNPPHAYDIALSLTRLNELIEHEPADLTVTCQAGIATGALQRRLAASGQMVPFALDETASDTIGGLLALNRSSLRTAYGTPRDFTIGLRVVTANGAITRAGGKVVKNVAGYDMCKLYIGSMGTLGVIVEATFKLYPRPARSAATTVRFDSPKAVPAFAREVRRRGLPVQQARLQQGAAGGYLLRLDFAASDDGISRCLAEIQQLANEAGAAKSTGEEIPNAPAEGGVLSLATAVLPSELPAVIAGFEAEARATFEADPFTGELSAIWPNADGAEQRIERLRKAATAAGGTLTVTRCPPDLKQRVDVFGEPPPSFPLMREVKQQIDPKGTLNPGRFVGGL